MPRIIGIDLGTSNSVVSLYENGKVKVLSFSRGVKVPVYTEKQIVALFGAAR